MLKRILFFFISATILVALFGCHAGGNAPFINLPEDEQVVVLNATVGENGKFPDVTFPSGTSIKCSEGVNLREGTELTFEERKTTLNGVSTLLYTLNASLNSVNITNSIEHPLNVTILNNSDSGTAYVGLRNNQNDTWRYSLATDGNTNIRYARLQAIPPRRCVFDLFKLGVQFALFVFQENKDDTKVDSVGVAADQPVSVKDGKYIGKLTLKLSVDGENLNNINIDNLTAKITYRSRNSKGANISFATNMTDTEDKTNATGFYEHSFEISGLTLKSSLGNNAELGLELNLDAISLDDFPYYFLVEVFSKGNTTGSNIRPFTYTKEFKFETKEQQNAPQPQLDSYTITLDPNGGTLNNTTIEYTAETEEFNLPTPTKTGYTFLGWTGTGLDNATTKVTIEKGSTGNRTYTANWQQNALDEYTLTLVSGTGIASIDDSKAYKANESITLNCTVKEGYEFDNWTDSNGNAVTNPFTMPANDVALTANAKVINYNITYDLADGALAEGVTNPTSFDVTSDTITLNEPTKVGYEFIGWTGSNGDTPQKPVSVVQGSKSDLNYVANYSIINYALIYNLDNGQLTKDNQTTYTVETESFTLTNPTKDYYDFLGWSGTGLTGNNNTTVTVSKGSTGAREYTANYTPTNYTITYTNIDGATFATANPTTYNVETETFTLTNPTKTDYTFKGWSGTGLTGDDNKAVTIPQGSLGDRTYTANFVDEYKITYNLSGGSTTNPATYSVLSGAIALTSPSRTGYEFIGWSGTDLTGDENTSVTIPQNATGNREYTANWKLILTLAIASDSGSVFEPVENNLYKFKPTFTITPVVADGVTLTDTQKANILSAIKVTDSTSTTLNTISKSWENGKIALSFSENLTASSTYTISSGDIDAVTLTCTPVSFTTICFSGSGTYDDPFLVATAEQLNMVRKYLSCHFKQTADISLASFDNWEPIGKDTNTLFRGSYDGDKKKITNLTLNDQQLSYYGLFGFSYGGILQNIYAEEFSINVDDGNGIGGICGRNIGFIEFCYVSGSTINSNSGEVGGICGCNTGTLNYCYVSGSTISNNSGILGGICGSGSIINCCYVASSTISSNNGFVGGISGTLNETINYCYVYLENQGKITGSSGKLGLIVGNNHGTIKDCFTNLTGNLFGDGNGSGSTTCCYDDVNDYIYFRGKTWSDGNTYQNNTSGWKNDYNYKTINSTKWPPDLTNNPRPQP